MDHPYQHNSSVAFGRTAARRFVVPLVAVCAMAIVGLAYLFRVGLIDDTYIFLRYARNLAEGNGPVFNVGERVEGFSSPLWTFLLGFAGSLGADLETAARVLGMCCGIGVVSILTYSIYRRTNLGRLDTAVLGIGLACSPALVFWSASGMDAPLFLILVAASFISALEDRRCNGSLSLRTATMLAMATLTRSEGVLVACYIGAFFLLERRRVRSLVFYGAFVAVMVLARFAYFGAWLPNTYYVKVTFDLSRRLIDGASYILPALGIHAILLALLLAVLVMAWKRRVMGIGTIVFLGGWAIIWCGYVLFVGGDNFSLFRFLLPVMPVLTLLFAQAWSAVRTSVRPGVRWVCPVILLLGFAFCHVLTYWTQAEFYLADQRLAAAWSKVGRWIDRETPRHTVIATIVPGALGYFGRRPTIDMLGLTDRQVATERYVFPDAVHGHARFNTDYIFEREPDVVIYHSSGRFSERMYADIDSIPKEHGYALYDFVHDPRCAERYEYGSVRLADGTWVEMQRKLKPTSTAAQPRNPPIAIASLTAPKPH